jgi:hypothetical protein
MRGRLRSSGLVVLSLAVGFLWATPGRTATLFVSPTATGANTGCTAAGYTTVQGGVDAASPGDTVYLCGTSPYFEQVIIAKTLALTGDDGAVIEAPPSFLTSTSDLPPQFATDGLNVPQAIVIVWGTGVTATISNLSITGPLPGNNSCAEDEYGILAIAGGTVSLVGDQVENIHDQNPALYGCQFGVGVQIGRRYWPTTGFGSFPIENFGGGASITNTTISSYQKNGITVDGPGSTATISNDEVDGSDRDAQFSVIIAQNGIQISRGAGGQVRKTAVAGNTYTGTAPATAAGILIYGGCGDPLVTGVHVMDNALTDNDQGIALINADPTCTTYPAEMTNDKATNNVITNDRVSNQGPFAVGSDMYTGYQSGIEDIGKNDKLINNDITGVGYTPAQTITGGPYVVPIDTTTFATSGAKVHANGTK